MGVFDDFYIFLNYYKSFKKESYEKLDGYIDDDDYDYDVDGDGNDTDVITDVELEVRNNKNTKAKRHVLSSNLQIIQADDLK